MTLLRDFLDIKDVMSLKRPELILKIGDCIAHSIVYTCSQSLFNDVIQSVTDKKLDMHQRKMFVNLTVILNVLEISHQLKEQNLFTDKEEGPNGYKIGKLINCFKDIKLDNLVRCIFRHQNSHSPQQVEDLVRISDSIIELACERKLINESKKKSYEDLKRNLQREYSDNMSANFDIQSRITSNTGKHSQ